MPGPSPRRRGFGPAGGTSPGMTEGRIGALTVPYGYGSRVALRLPGTTAFRDQRHTPNRLALDQQPHRFRKILQRQAVRDVGADTALLRPLQQRLQPRLAQ